MAMMEVMAKRLKVIRVRIDGKRDLAAVKADAEAITTQCPKVSRQQCGTPSESTGNTSTFTAAAF